MVCICIVHCPVALQRGVFVCTALVYFVDARLLLFFVVVCIFINHICVQGQFCLERQRVCSIRSWDRYFYCVWLCRRSADASVIV